MKSEKGYFKLEDVYVPEAKLGAFLRMCTGLVVGSPRPVPMTNAKKGKGNKLVAASAKANANGTFSSEQVAEKLAEFLTVGGTFTPAEIAAVTGSKSGAYYHLTRLIAIKAAAKTKERGVYTWKGLNNVKQG